MSQTEIFPKPDGATYTIPDVDDTGWGQNVTNFLLAIANGVIPRSGSYGFTGDVTITGGFGFILPYLKTTSSLIATAGQVRLAKTDLIEWRNHDNSGNLTLGIDGSDHLIFNGTDISSLTSLTDSHIFVGNGSNVPTDVAMSGDVHISNVGATTIQTGAVTAAKIANDTITNTQINSAAAIAYSKLVLTGSIVNADINASAAIATSKLAAAANFFFKDGSVTATGDWNMGGNEIKSAKNPTTDQSLATKIYVDTQISAGVPSGTILQYGVSTAPGGWLVCDGSAVSRSTYSTLFGILGTVWGAGDGSTTFNLPDFRGRALYGKTGSGAYSTYAATGDGDTTNTGKTALGTFGTVVHSVTANFDFTDGTFCNAFSSGAAIQSGTHISSHSHAVAYAVVIHIIKT